MNNPFINLLLEVMASAKERAAVCQPSSINRYYAFDYNVLEDADGYKFSHYLQIPDDTTYISSYIESRAGGKFDKLFWTTFQPLLKEFLTRRLTANMVEYMKVFCANYGSPFNYEGFMRIVNEFDGRWPVRIRAIPEGLVVNPGVVLVDFEPTHPDFAFASSWLETQSLRAAWYGSTVGTVAYRVRKLLESWLEKTTDIVRDSDEWNITLAYMLNDFGSRGASSPESARLGGLSMLATGFRGTDTAIAVGAATKWYHEGIGTAGNTAAASEHSTASLQGEDGEVDFNDLMCRRFGHLPLFASVIDSFDPIKNVRENWCGTNKEAVLAMNARLVLRPDSGYPPAMALTVIEELAGGYGTTLNEKGLKVLNDKVRVIYGDGINEESINDILQTLFDAGYAANNICFGMGGALMQACDRDWMRFAQKTNETEYGGIRRDVCKKVISDPSKSSKSGRYTTLINKETGKIFSVPQKDLLKYQDCIQILVPVFEDGYLLQDYSLAEIRRLAMAQ